MPDFLSDSYTHDMMTTIRQLALTAAGAEDYELAQQLYAVLFELQMRQDVALTKLASAVDAAAPPRVETLAAARERERLRLVPTIAGPPQLRPPGQPWAPAACVKCGASDRQLQGGLCEPCHFAACICGGEIKWQPGDLNGRSAAWLHTGRGPWPGDCPGRPRDAVRGPLQL